MTTAGPATDTFPGDTDSGTAASDEWIGRLLVWGFYVLIGIVGLTVLLVSGDYLHKFALEVQIAGWMSWTLPIALDAGGIGGALCGFIGHGRARGWGWSVAAANLASSVTANALGHLLDTNQITATTWMTILTGVVYPVELAVMVHLALALRAERMAARRDRELDELAAHQREQERSAQQQARAHEDRQLMTILSTQLAIGAMLRPRPAPRRRVPAKPAPPRVRPLRAVPAVRAISATEVTPEQYAGILAEARALRAQRAERKLRTGRRTLTKPPPEGLGISDPLARQVLREIDAPTQLRPTAAGDAR